MANILVPNGSRVASPTAVSGLGDRHDGLVYSAGVLENAGTGMIPLFTVQQGQAMLRLGAAVPLQAHQATYTPLTTNLDRPSQLGDNIGDAAVRALGITIEAAAFVITGATAGTARNWGATQFEVAEILGTCTGEFKIGGKSQMQSPLFGFPGLGGIAGSISTTGTFQTASIASNGAVPVGRQCRSPMMLARTDAFRFELATANGYALAFSAGGADNRPVLVWCVLAVDLLSDVR